MRFNKFTIIFYALSILTIFSACDSELIGAFIEPKEYDFGYVESSKTYRFSITNNTSKTIKVTSADFTGSNPDKFKITDNNAPFSIYPKSNQFITVEFTPNGYGSMESSLIIGTDFKGTFALRTELKGYGLSTEFDPKTFDFGVVKSTETKSKTFTLINQTQRNLSVNSYDISGPDSSHFNVASGTTGTITANGGQLQVTVDFNPFTEGPKTATLNANLSDSIFPVVSANLTGEGDVVLIETFDTTQMCDAPATIADWGTSTPGKLTPFGSLVVFQPSVSGKLNADSGPYSFTSINIPQGVTITVTGSKALEIYCSGNVIIDGELILDGDDGDDAPSGKGGAGGPGGSSGGDYDSNGKGSGGGLSGNGAGGGAGFAVTGCKSTNNINGGSSYGNPELNPLVGGSGGGGGFSAGAGGGGGGGAMSIVASGNIVIGGLISANGGDGGGHLRPAGSSTYGGGGGSGGAIKLISLSDIVFNGGSISVLGGMGDDGYVNGSTSRRRGGYGSSGRIRLEDQDGTIDGMGGSIFPIPSAAKVTSAFVGGTGVDGAFSPATNITLDTSNGPFNFTTVNIPAGVTVTATGNNPLEIYSTGGITIAGTIDISGGDGGSGTNVGIGIAGGADGGEGGAPGYDGYDGKGQGGGEGGQYSGWSTSSGGGFGTDGQQGSTRYKFPGGASYGTADLNPLIGGSGGGGGCGRTSSYTGGAGGAGGGALRLQSASTINVTGKLISEGGNGAPSGGSLSQAGSGGSGGAILIQGDTVSITGTVSARGGKGNVSNSVSGGYSRDYDEAFCWMAAWGGEGRIRIETYKGENYGGLIYTTKGKEAVPVSTTTNPELVGTCSISTVSNNVGVFAQSKFYDSTISSPTWQNAVVNGTDLSSMIIRYQSADGDSNGNPIPSTYSQWVDDLSLVPQKRFVRFKVYFLMGSGNPSIDDIELPFN